MSAWERDGETVVNSGEIEGMDAPTWGHDDDDFQNEIVGDYFTGYYRDDDRRAASTYYVVRTKSWNQPEPEVVWVVEEVTWVGVASGPDEDIEELDRTYESASALFYDSQERAERVARRLADTDESYAFS